MTKKILYQILFAFNILALIMAFLQTIFAFNGMTRDDFEVFNFWRMNVTYFVLVFWIWNMIIWSNKDKKVGRFLALFFLPGLYTLLYYNQVIKNKWIDKNE